MNEQRGRVEYLMDFIYPAVVIALVVASGIQLWRSSSPKSRNRAIDRMTREAHLALPPELEAEVAARVLSRERAMLVGTMAALLVASAPIYFITDSDQGIVWAVLLLFIASAWGATIGAFVTEARSAFAPVLDAPRIARSRTPTIGDYISAPERWYIPVSQCLAGALLLTALVLIVLNPDDTFARGALLELLLPAGLFLAGIVAWVLGAIAAEKLLRPGQPAGSFTELAWRDALRASTLRSVNTLPAVIAFTSSFVTLITLSKMAAGHGPDTLGNTIVGIVGLLILIPMFAMALRSGLGRRAPHYLRQLWPETAAQLAASPGGYGPIISRTEPEPPETHEPNTADRVHSSNGSR